MRYPKTGDRSQKIDIQVVDGYIGFTNFLITASYAPFAAISALAKILDVHAMMHTKISLRRIHDLVYRVSCTRKRDRHASGLGRDWSHPDGGRIRRMILVCNSRRARGKILIGNKVVW